MRRWAARCLAAALLWARGRPEAAPAAAPGDAALLWAALRRATGLGDAELRRWARELEGLPPPAQRGLWGRVRCGEGWCAGEAVSRLIALLGEHGKIPQRGFEPFPGDPLYELWKAEDKQDFQSWASGTDAPEDAPLAAFVPEGQPLAIGRVQAAEFMRQARRRILELIGHEVAGLLGRCLEWDEPFYAVKVFGGLCRHFDVLTYANPSVGQEPHWKTYPQGTRILSADILRLPAWFPRDYGVVVCLFVLEHVPDPHAAMRGIARVLLPGGLLLLGAPFVDGVHACPNDYFRYTPSGLRLVAERAGLEVLWSYAPGSPALAAGELLGMKSSYWPEAGLLEESDSHPGNVFLLARKQGSSRLGPMRWNGSSAPYEVTGR